MQPTRAASPLAATALVALPVASCPAVVWWGRCQRPCQHQRSGRSTSTATTGALAVQPPCFGLQARLLRLLGWPLAAATVRRWGLGLRHSVALVAAAAPGPCAAAPEGRLRRHRLQLVFFCALLVSMALPLLLCWHLCGPWTQKAPCCPPLQTVCVKLSASCYTQFKCRGAASSLAHICCSNRGGARQARHAHRKGKHCPSRATAYWALPNGQMFTGCIHAHKCQSHMK